MISSSIRGADAAGIGAAAGTGRVGGAEDAGVAPGRGEMRGALPLVLSFSPFRAVLDLADVRVVPCEARSAGAASSVSHSPSSSLAGEVNLLAPATARRSELAVGIVCVTEGVLDGGSATLMAAAAGRARARSGNDAGSLPDWKIESARL